MRAVSLDPPIILLGASEFADYQERLCDSGVNTVGVSVGRLDWAYFRWAGQEARWSSPLKGSQRDPVAEALQALASCPAIQHASAIIDVFAPLYIADHPWAAAHDVDGKLIPHQVSTVELAQGDFGDELVEMVSYIARQLPVQSITLTELFYYHEGYGATDLASFKRYSGLDDWPRRRGGSIDVDHPQIGRWRSQLVASFVERAAEAAHRHGKQLFVDVRVPWGDLSDRGRKQGQEYGLLLKHADRLVLWVYYGLNDYPPSYMRDVAAAYRGFGEQQLILSIGMWSRGGGAILPAELEAGLSASTGSALRDIWVTPASLISQAHWNELEAAWR